MPWAKIFSFDLLLRIHAALQGNKGYTRTLAIAVTNQKFTILSKHDSLVAIKLMSLTFNVNIILIS
jgi:hypothetical protein